jgi:Uma2 family endonuclease
MTAAARRPAIQLPPPMTADEFFAMPDDGSGTKYELIDGYLVAMAPAAPMHGRLQLRLGQLISNHLAATRSRCWAATEIGVQPSMQANTNVRVPDLGISCTPLSLKDKAMQEPVLLAEILSPSNVSATRANVWIYASIRSVREILLVHSTEPKLELFRRLDDGQWSAKPEIASADGAITLDCIDMALTVEELYRDTPLLSDDDTNDQAT